MYSSTRSPGLHLSVFGMPALQGLPEERVDLLRKKDLALLVFLCVEAGRTHSRSALAGLLWGDNPEDRARHSLTQALGRLRKALGDDAFSLTDERVAIEAEIPCDTDQLEAALAGSVSLDHELDIYVDDFLESFNVGAGAAAFEHWAEEKRLRYRLAALRLLERWGADAERRNDWDAALKLGHRALEIEYFYEAGHRRVMRAWSNMGETAMALRHYQRLERRLADELELEPDPATRTVADALGSDLPLPVED